jgi:FMN-dependent NADH-azoreductase
MKALHIESSLFAEAGVSSQLSRELIARLKQQYPDLEVIEKHFADQPIPYFDGATLTAIATDPSERTPEQQRIAAFADRQIAELQQADLLVIGMPMYNYGVPSMLKSWFDFVARAGVTFRYTEQGSVGLLTGKKAYVIATRGGKHQGTPADSQTAFVTTFLNFLGIDNIDIIYAEGLNMGELERQTAITEAKQKIEQLIGLLPAATH